MADLTVLKYSTYATAWNGAQLPYLTIWLDLDGNGSRDDRLWFEPEYSNGGYGNGDPNPQAPVALNIWQTWDALNGMWYSDDPVTGPGANAVTLGTYLSLAGKANATIIDAAPGTVGGIRLASGFASPGDNYNTYIDNVTIGTASGSINYDFETAAVPEPTATLFGGLVCGVTGVGVGLRRLLAKPLCDG